MIKAKGNSGSEKAPTPKAVMVFKGIQGLIASGPGTKKKVVEGKVRPEKNQGAKIPSPSSTSVAKPGQALAQPSAGVVKPHGGVSLMPKINPEGATRRDSAGVVKHNS